MNSKMNIEIDKLVYEYNEKIADREVLLEELNTNITKLRRDTSSKGLEDITELRAQRAVQEARKQAYITAKHDFLSLLDIDQKNNTQN